VAKGDLGSENVGALVDGLENLGRHLRNIGQFGVPAVVAINKFTLDTPAEIQAIRDYCVQFGAEVFECNHWAEGGAGTIELAEHVSKLADSGQSQFRPLYDDHLSLWEKVRTVARTIYGADDIIADKKVRSQFEEFEERYSHFPVCMAKTQYSFSTDPNLLGAPTGHMVPIRELRLSAGAEFVVAICGEIMTMPGLPRVPAANSIFVNESGEIEGLF
jgi:formate--tetrahydrofolate ligase